MRRSVEVTHFDEVVKSVHASLRRDLTEVETTATGIGVPVDRPAVVLLTTDPPIADRRSVGAFRELAAEATIIWLVPRKTEGLVNPVFGDRGPAAVLGESDSIADHVCEIVRTGVLPTARNPFGAALAPSSHSTAS